jgi:glutathione S-transferase
MSKITVFETTGFPNPARVRAALAEKKALDQVEFVEVDVMTAQHRTPEFYAMNPMGAVPVLRAHDGTFISESTAITEYIDHHFAGPALTGRTALERAEIHMMQRRAEGMVMDAVSVLSWKPINASLGERYKKAMPSADCSILTSICKILNLLLPSSFRWPTSHFSMVSDSQILPNWKFQSHSHR